MRHTIWFSFDRYGFDWIGLVLLPTPKSNNKLNSHGSQVEMSRATATRRLCTSSPLSGRIWTYIYKPQPEAGRLAWTKLKLNPQRVGLFGRGLVRLTILKLRILMEFKDSE